MGKIKSLSLILITCWIIYSINYYCANKSPMFNIFGFVFAAFCCYWYRKLVLFLQIRIKQYQENNMLSTDISVNSICKFPVMWSSKLHYKSTPFLEACKNGNTILVKQYIRAKVNIHEVNIFGEGAVFLATYNLLQDMNNRDASCIWALHNAGCSINLANKDGFTPLHLAAFKGHCSLINWLIRKGADVNVEPSPAGLALVRGHKKAAAILLSHQYKMSISNEAE